MRQGSDVLTSAPLPGADLAFTGNTGLNYAGRQLGPTVSGDSNVLK